MSPTRKHKKFVLKFIFQAQCLLVFLIGSIVINEPVFAQEITSFRFVDGKNGVFDVKGKSISLADKPEFFRDTIQFTLKNAKVEKAILSTQDGKINKVFAYPYAPGLVRVRLTVSGDAKNYEKSFQVQALKSGTSISLTGESDEVLAKSIKLNKINPDSSSVKNEDTKNSVDVLHSEQSKKTTPDVNPLLGAKAVGANLVDSKLSLRRESPPSFGKIIGIVIFVLFVGAAFFLRKKIAKSIRKEDPWMEVLATHYLAPKKRLSLVKIQGRRMVIGVTDESIQLITELEDDEEWSPISNAGKNELNLFREPMLASHVTENKSEEFKIKPPVSEKDRESIRDRVRDRLKGYKSL